jgi:hypothetical protein
MVEPAPVGVELVARNEAGPDPAGDRPQLTGADQRADVLLRATELGGNVVHGQAGYLFDDRSIVDQDVAASTTRSALRPARSAACAASDAEGASKTKKHVSSLGT